MILITLAPPMLSVLEIAGILGRRLVDTGSGGRRESASGEEAVAIVSRLVVGGFRECSMRKIASIWASS